MQTVQNTERQSARRVMRLPEVEHVTGKTRVTIYRDELAGRFPTRVKLGRNSIGWYSDEIEAWLCNLPRGGGMNPRGVREEIVTVEQPTKKAAA